MTQAEAEWLLAECRRKIDAIDLQLRDLLNRRAEVAEEIVRAKVALGMPVRHPQREREVLQKVTGENPGPLTEERLRRIFEVIIQEIRDLQSSRLPEKQRGTPEW
jgi:chorismate mutase